MDHFELAKLRNRLVRFKNETTKLRFGNIWLQGHLTSVMSYLVTIDGEPYSRVDLEVEEIKNG